MAYKTFIVSHAKARYPIAVKGRTLEEALKKEGLNPAIWKEQLPLNESEAIYFDENQGDGRQEDY